MPRLQEFRAAAIRKGDGASLPLPFSPDEVWGVKSRHYVTGSVHGCRIRATLEAENGEWNLTLGPAWIRDNPIPTEPVLVRLEPEGPQIGELAADIEAAFAAAPEVKPFFEGLATFYRKGFIEPIEAAKRPATRAARIEEMIAMLREGKRQK